MVELPMRIKGLVQLGLTQYEAKSYTALLALGQGKGYAIAKHAEIPTSKIYQVLSSLEAKAFVKCDGMEKPLYKAEDPDKIIGTQKIQFEKNMNMLLTDLKKITPKEKTLNTRYIIDRSVIEKSLRDLINSAKEKILITAWPEDLEFFRGEFEKTSKSVKLFILSYGEFKMKDAEIFIHRRVDLVEKELSGRWLVSVADSGQAIVAFFSSSSSVNGIWTESKNLAKVFADYILHDISLNYLMGLIPKNLAKNMESDLTSLRKKLYIYSLI